MKTVFVNVSFICLFVAVFAAVTAFSQPGAIDSTFGIGGSVVTSPPAVLMTHTVSKDMVIQSDGKVVVLSRTMDVNNAYSGVLTRFTADGSIDASFGIGGFAYLTWGAPNYCIPSKVAIQIVNGEERFVVVGSGGCGGTGYVRVERFTQWGAPDTTFGTGGVTTINAIWFPQNFSIAIQNDQKILLAGGANPMVRLKANGTADTTFGPNGISRTNAGITIMKAAALSNGKIVAAGYVWNGSNYDFAAVRFNSNSSLDTSFGTRGKTLVDFAGLNDIGFDMKVDSAGKIIVSGKAADTSVVPDGSQRGALIRLKSDGKRDTTFGTNGRSALLQSSIALYFVTVQSNGKIVASGPSMPTVSAGDVLTARYNSNGSLDSGYDGDGWNTFDFYGSEESIANGLIQNDPGCGCAKLVVGGNTWTEPYTGVYDNPRYIFGLRFNL